MHHLIIKFGKVPYFKGCVGTLIITVYANAFIYEPLKTPLWSFCAKTAAAWEKSKVVWKLVRKLYWNFVFLLFLPHYFSFKSVPLIGNLSSSVLGELHTGRSWMVRGLRPPRPVWTVIAGCVNRCPKQTWKFRGFTQSFLRKLLWCFPDFCYLQTIKIHFCAWLFLSYPL